MNIMQQEMRRKMRRRFYSTTLAAVLGFTGIFSGNTDWIAQNKVLAAKEQTQKVTEEAEQVNAEDYGLCDNSKDGAILHAFCWSFNTIKENMKDIAEAGYTTVQTSPANACNDSHPGMILYDPNNKDDSYDGSAGCWWWHYQPTDWTVGNYQLGTREEYKAMCDEAEKYGVKIITDVLPNHTTPEIGKVSSNLANAAGGKGKGQLYHTTGFDEIGDYNNRFECTLGQMGGLPDVNTENQGFQAYYLKYCNDIISLGCDGFRYDTAKHIGVPSDPKDSSNTRGVNDFWDVATGKKSVNGVSLDKANELFIYGEVLQDRNIPYEEYASYMNMTASGYGDTLRGAVGSKDFGTGRISNWNHSTPDRIVTWVESHDTYFNKHPSAWMNDWQIRACWAIIAARDNGTPLFFSRPDGSNGSSGNYVGNNVLGAKGNDQFKHPEVAACNHFRNAMVGEKETLSNPSNNNSVLIIERGTKGAVIINMGSDISNIKLQKVADGTYTEEVSGKQVEVSGGTLNYTVPGGTVAVVYNPGPVTKDPTVSVSKAEGTFMQAFDLTLTAKNATKASYSVNGGAAVEFTDKATVKIGEGCAVGDKVTVKVTATGEGTPFEKTFTYTMVDVPPVPEAKFLVRVKKSDFTSAPYIYAYGKGETAKEYAGKWPGTKLEDDGGDYYIFKSDDMDSATVILHDGTDGGWRNTQEGETEAVVTGKMDYDKASNKFTKVEEVVKTEPPKTEPPKTEPPKTEPPKSEPPKTEPPKTQPPVEQLSISASLADGAVFKTETQDVELTFKNAKEVTYSVDGGPKRTVDATKNEKVTVTLGQGKIGNSKVTLEVEAKNDAETKKQTFTYTKEFVKTKGTATVLAVFANDVAEKITESAETVNGAPASDYYATNPNGNLGAKKTIKSAGDFTEDMIIAQGVANDDPAAFRGTHEAPKFDPYAMYGAWDDENLYIGIQYTNVIDVADPAQQAPQTGRGKPNGADADIPQMLVFDTRTGDYTDGTANDTVQKTAWDIDVKFGGDAKVDKVFLYSPKDGIINQAFFPVTDGVVDYTKVTKSGYNKPPIPGVETTWEDGFFGTSMYGIKGTGYTGYKPADLESDSGNWVDFLSEGHSKEHDTFCIVKLPLSLLGVTAADIESKGIGVMAIATYGSSGIGCLPADMTMLDVAGEAYSKDDSTSREKEDSDLVTVSLAQLGKSNGVITTKPPVTKPPVTQPPCDSQPPVVSSTPSASATADVSTPPVDEKIYCVNFGADKSSPQLNTTTLTLSAEGYDGAEPYKYEFYIDDQVVQQASEKNSYTWSNPQAGEHVIKMVMTDKNGQETVKLKKYVIEAEGTEVPKTGEPKPTNEVPVNSPIVNTPAPTGSIPTAEVPTVVPPTTVPTGNPVVTETPAPATIQPTATTPININTTPTVQPSAPATQTPSSVPTGVPTAVPTATQTPPVNPYKDLALKLTTNKTSPQVKGTKIVLNAAAAGGSGKYTYSFMAEKEDGDIVRLSKDDKSSSVTWTASAAGKYKLIAIVKDTETGLSEFASVPYTITVQKTVAAKTLKYKYFKANKSKIARKKKIVLTAYATPKKGKVQYKFYYKKKGAKKAAIIYNFGTARKVSWRVPAKTGVYYVYCKAKDSTGKSLAKKVTIKVVK